jgi:hypothetical protein
MKKVCFNRCIKWTEFEFYSVIDDIFAHKEFLTHSKNLSVDSVDVPQCVYYKKNRNFTTFYTLDNGQP